MVCEKHIVAAFFISFYCGFSYNIRNKDTIIYRNEQVFFNIFSLYPAILMFTITGLNN